MAAESTELLTLNEAADRLGVHYMTVYRRVRLGMLAARKVGGQWRVDPVDLAGTGRAAAGRRAKSIGETPARAARTARRAPWGDRLRARMLAGDVAGSWQVVEAAMAAGVEPADVYVEILGPAMHGIGDAWQRGELGIDQEHLATSVALSIVGRMGSRFQRRGRRLGTVLVAMPTGERHMLGAAMLADILSLSGYEVLNLGADTPPASLAQGRRRARRPARGHRHRRGQQPPGGGREAHRRGPPDRWRPTRDRRGLRGHGRRDRPLDRRRRVGRRSA